MAFKITWTVKAQKDRLAILEYWTDRNKSRLFAVKLNEIFNSRIELLSHYPNLGKKTDMRNIRVLIVRDYLIFYKIIDNIIFIISLFDARQNPKKFKRIK